jgi:glycosyltransferase involved in cell wall biosynthesis
VIKLSIIIPVFNEAENIIPVLQDIRSSLQDSYEVIYVDDGSTDETLSTIINLSQQDKSIKCISLSRNFGHQNALMAGMQHAKGDYIITMDGDGQHPPYIITEIIKKLDEGYDVVNTKRNKTNNAGLLKKTTAFFFYKFINIISDTRIEANQADFRGFTKKVLSCIFQFEERELFLRGIFSWLGFKNTTIQFDAPERLHGTTKYSFGKMLKLALKATTSFSFKPLRIALLIGVIISFTAFGFGIFALIEYYKGNTVPGWASMIIAVMFLGGCQLLAIGLLGEYIASLFVESKKRPLYLVDKKINID